MPTTADEVRQKIRNAEELVLDEEGELITMDEFHRRLESRFDRAEVRVDEDGVTHYKDTGTGSDPDEFSESIYADGQVPVSLCTMAIEMRKKPSEIIEDPEEHAETYNQFEETVDEEFERQLEEEDDPFPLEFPPKEEP